MDKVKILFLVADPSDSARLRLGQELRDVRNSLQHSKQRDNFVLESRESVRPGDITQAIHDIEPQIVHFSGHGNSTGELLFEDLQGKAKPVPPDALANLFELVSKQVSCVVLNACYSEPQAKAIAKYIPYVLGMSKAIGDQAAIKFAVGFYKALGAGRSFKDAYKFARVEIQMEDIKEYLTPVIYGKNQQLNNQQDIKQPKTEKGKEAISSPDETSNKDLYLELEFTFANRGQIKPEPIFLGDCKSPFGFKRNVYKLKIRNGTKVAVWLKFSNRKIFLGNKKIKSNLVNQFKDTKATVEVCVSFDDRGKLKFKATVDYAVRWDKYPVVFYYEEDL